MLSLEVQPAINDKIANNMNGTSAIPIKIQSRVPKPFHPCGLSAAQSPMGIIINKRIKRGVNAG